VGTDVIERNAYRVNLESACEIKFVCINAEARLTICIAIPCYQIWGTGHSGLTRRKRNWQ
jgi:hypothetical protein